MGHDRRSGWRTDKEDGTARQRREERKDESIDGASNRWVSQQQEGHSRDDVGDKVPHKGNHKGHTWTENKGTSEKRRWTRDASALTATRSQLGVL